MDADVVVVGGGPVGLAACTGLAHQGVQRVVLLTDPDRERRSRAFGIWARSCETLRDWGVFDDLAARGRFLRRLDPLDGASGRPLLRFDLGALDRDSPTAGVLIVPQYTTEDVLREHVERRTATETVVARAGSVDQDGDGVRVTARRADGGTVTVRARYAVGADGAHSTVRRRLGLRLDGTTYPTRMVLADVRLPGDAGLGSMRFATHHPGFLAGIRFGEDLWRVMATVDRPGDEHEHEWRRRTAALFGGRPTETLWSSAFALHRRAARTFRVGRVLLAGDAAHLLSPAGGQGMNSGLQDAENLAWKLAAALDGGTEEALLSSYDDERRGLVTGAVARTAERTQRAEFGLPHRAKAPLLAALGLVARPARVARPIARSVSMLGHRYGSSALLAGRHRTSGLRLSDPVLPSGRRLSDELQGRAGLVAVGTDVPPLDGALGTDLVRVVLPGPPAGWRVRRGDVVVVRPDRHAGAVLHRPATAVLEAAVAGALGRSRDGGPPATGAAP